MFLLAVGLFIACPMFTPPFLTWNEGKRSMANAEAGQGVSREPFFFFFFFFSRLQQGGRHHGNGPVTVIPFIYVFCHWEAIFTASIFRGKEGLRAYYWEKTASEAL
ncbi:hypothetical protein F5Y13DRAFT_44341 [Hypoxylon sp. FL1857]|nr:hypothetical protein F5Y13DRAFT_44341 [Hypoxylon sp. FL1857]